MNRLGKVFRDPAGILCLQLRHDDDLVAWLGWNGRDFILCAGAKRVLDIGCRIVLVGKV